MTDPKTDADATRRSQAERLDDWRLLPRRAARPVRDRRLRHRASSWSTGSARRPRRPNHHPDVDLTLPAASTSTCVSHDVGGVTSRDVAAGPADQRARRRARRRGRARATCPGPRARASTPPTLAAVKPFWAARARLRRTRTDDAEVVDPDGAQQHAVVPGRTEPTREAAAALPPRHRGAAARWPRRGSRAALAAGGTLVSDDGGPGVLGARRRRTATRSASAPPDGPRACTDRMWDRRPRCWDACHTRVTAARPRAATVGPCARTFLYARDA